MGNIIVSIKVTSWIWENSKAEGSALLLLLAIADHAHDDGGGAYPSVETLAKKCRQTARNTQFLLRKLERDGHLQTEVGAGPHGCNLYRIVLDVEISGGVKASARGVKYSVKTVPQISPEPSLTVIEPSLSLGAPAEDEIRDTPSPKRQALETLEKAFFQYGGTLSPALIEKFYLAFEGNPDHPAERLQHSLKRLHEKKNFFSAIDAYREWSLPKPPPVYSPRREQFARPTPPPYREKTPEEVAAFHAALAKGGP